MATEGPLIHDGSQCTAAVDLSSTAGKAGFNGTGQFLVVALTAARSLNIAASAAVVPYGILQNDPTAGFACDVGIYGVSKAIAGAVTSIVAGSPLMADAATGRLILAATASNFVVAIALEVPAAINNVFTVKIVGGYNHV